MPSQIVLRGNCLKYLRKLKTNSVDAVISDPPYGIEFLGKHTPWDKVLPDTEVWAECLRVLKPGGYLAAFSFDKMYHRLAVNVEDVGFEIRAMLGWIQSESMPKSRNIAIDMENAGHTDFADYAGIGTGLRPSIEPIVLARKELEGTLAECTRKYGTGGLAIDKCRMLGDRWPANILFAEPEALLFDASNVGTPSSYFFVPKVKGGERDAGLDAFPWIEPTAINGRKEGSAGINNPRAGARSGKRKNPHPTPKPIDLMAWLVRLLTPRGGLVIDPFAGSGSTGCACALEGRDFVGYELDEFGMKYEDGSLVSFTDIGNARIRYWAGEVQTETVVDSASLYDEDAFSL